MVGSAEITGKKWDVSLIIKKLKVGMKVRFAEEMGVKGPQASSVTVI